MTEFRKTTIVEISIGPTTIRIETPRDAPVEVKSYGKQYGMPTEAQRKAMAEKKSAGTLVHERKSRGGWTIPDRAPDHCSRCGAEGRRMNHEAGGCIECREFTDDDLMAREAPWTFVDED